MARGRFISNAIITDRQIHDLSSDTCRLAYTWLITLADREGRVTGEPDMLLAQLFPRRLNEITPDDIEGFINEWVNAGFVIWYEGSDGDKVLQLVNFEKHQVGMRKMREPTSSFRDPENCRIIAGSVPEHIPLNRIEENVNVNGNSGENSDIAFQEVWEQETGSLVSSPTAFIGMLAVFAKEGVTPEIYRTAIREQKASGKYPVTNPTSVKNWAIGLVKNAKANGSGKKIKKYGPDGEVIMEVEA
jgi:hypothetical protein